MYALGARSNVPYSERAVQAIRHPVTTSFSATILEPFKDLSEFVSRVDELLTSSSAASEIPNLAKFLRDLRASTWKDIKSVLSR